jgi:hypothetical protein
MTLIALAAAYPHGDFLGADYMPEHVVRANHMIEAVGLTNIKVIEASFGEMAANPPEEKFDFAAAHGVWSWVPDEVRGEIVEVLRTWMAPGALCYLGYNAAAGWAALEPVRHVFRNTPQGQGKDRYKVAREGVQFWIDQMGDGAGQMGLLWSKIKGFTDDFLAHELGSPNGTGDWNDKVAARLENAKFNYAGPAVLVEHMDAMYLDDDQLAFLKKAISDGWGEIARDLVHRRTFRNDLFHRGAPGFPAEETIAAMRKLRVVPWAQDIRLGTHPSVYGQLKREISPEGAARIQEIASEPGATFGDCMDGLGIDTPQAFQGCIMALVAGVLLDIRPEETIAAAQPACDRLNALLLERYRNGAFLPGLVSPVWGGCLHIEREDHLDALRGKVENPDLTARMKTLGISLDF